MDISRNWFRQQVLTIVIIDFRSSLLFLLSLFFFYVYCFWPTSGKLPRLKFCFPPYFGITRRNMKKKKNRFSDVFFLLFPACVRSQPTVWIVSPEMGPAITHIITGALLINPLQSLTNKENKLNKPLMTTLSPAQHFSMTQSKGELENWTVPSWKYPPLYQQHPHGLCEKMVPLFWKEIE